MVLSPTGDGGWRPNNVTSITEAASSSTWFLLGYFVRKVLSFYLRVELRKFPIISGFSLSPVAVIHFANLSDILRMKEPATSDLS